ACMFHFIKLGLPGGLVGRFALWIAQSMSNADFSLLRPIEQAAHLRTPTLVLSGGNDPFAPQVEEQISKYQCDSLKFGKVLNADHLGALNSDPAAYQTQIAAFLSTISNRKPAPAPLQ